MAERKYDLLVWGATGFTGKWVAKHLFDHYSDGSLKWGIAGRNPDKLNDVREFIGDHSSSTQGELTVTRLINWLPIPTLLSQPLDRMRITVLS